MENWKKKAVELLAGIALTEKEDPAAVPYTPQKVTIPAEATPSHRRSAPEKHGIESRRLTEMLHAMERDPRVNIHNLLVVADGEVILECSHPGYGVRQCHLAHSMSKTVTGLAVGFLFDEGRLTTDDTLCGFFPEIPYRDKRFADITVEDLLIMSTGVPFAEAGSVTEAAWTETFFSSNLTFTPGTDFAYNSMNSYMLAKIVGKLTGMSLTEYLKPRLLDPLGITEYLWEMGPEGMEKGGWGLYLAAEDWAKIGEMVLGGGVYRGRRILSEEWIARATSTQSVTPAKTGDFNYGYQLWVARENDEILFNGMLGQNVWIAPRRHLAAVINAGNNELFSQSPSLDILRRYLGDAWISVGAPGRQDAKELAAAVKDFFTGRHWIRPLPSRTGLAVLFGLKEKHPFDPAFAPLLGTYLVRRNNYGILPLFVRAMQNNYAGGIRSLTFDRDGEDLVFVCREGTEEYRMPVGFYDFRETTLSIHGEAYLVRCMAQAMEDEDRNRIYKLEILFPELPNTRRIKLSFTDDGSLLIRMEEMPDERIAETFFSSMTSSPKMSFFMDILDRKLGADFLGRKLRYAFHPVLLGIPEDAPDREERLLAEENKRQSAIGENRFLLRLIEKYLSPEEEKEKPNRGAIGNFLSFLGLGKARKEPAEETYTPAILPEVEDINLPDPEDETP